MEKVEGLTKEQANEMLENAKAEGYTETQTIENVPVGAVSGKPHTLNVKVNGKMQKSASYSLIPFVRKDAEGNDIKLIFRGIKYDVTHLSTAKSFSNVVVKATDEIEKALAVTANLAKDTLFDSVTYGKEGRTILKFQSIG